MADLAEAIAEIAQLHDLYREQGLELNRLAFVQNIPLQVNVEVLSDLLPDPCSGTDDSVNSERFFREICFLVRIT